MEPKAQCPAAIPPVERTFHVLVGVTGSVAALKLPLLISKLLDIPGVSVLSRQVQRLLALGSHRSWGQLISAVHVMFLSLILVCIEGPPLGVLVCRAHRRQASVQDKQKLG